MALVITWALKGPSDPVGLVYPASSSVVVGQLGRILLASSHRQGELRCDLCPGGATPRAARCTSARAHRSAEDTGRKGLDLGA